MTMSEEDKAKFREGYRDGRAMYYTWKALTQNDIPSDFREWSRPWFDGNGNVHYQAGFTAGSVSAEFDANDAESEEDDNG